MNLPRSTAAMLATFLLAAPATASITVTQDASAPTYGTQLSFDEPGTPQGVIPADAFLADYGLVIDAGDGVPQVGNFDPGWGLGQGNSFFGFFGVFMTWEQDLEALSLQVWDPSGPPSPMGGGLGVFIFNDGVEILSGFFEPAWGGLGNSWFDITATDGMVFDEVRILGFGFDPSTYVDTLSWNVVPGPGAVALLGLAGFAAGRRRRA